MQSFTLSSSWQHILSCPRYGLRSQELLFVTLPNSSDITRRYILTVAVFSGMCIGALTVIADLMIAIRTGT
eukprot:8249973-Ditylum_brightwellii.AAC.1